MAYSATLRALLCTTRDTEAFLLSFVSSFNALIADPSSLSAAVGNHPGRQRSNKRISEKNDGKKTSHGKNPLG